MTRKMPEQSERVECGPVQFGEDWPGIFLRGDNALYYALCIDQVLDNPQCVFEKVALRGLTAILRRCDVRADSALAQTEKGSGK